MAWQQNLFSNLLVLGILLALAIIIYASVKKKTLVEIYQEMREIGKVGVEE